MWRGQLASTDEEEGTEGVQKEDTCNTSGMMPQWDPATVAGESRSQRVQSWKFPSGKEEHES